MKESDKGTVKEAIFMMEGLLITGPLNQTAWVTALSQAWQMDTQVAQGSALRVCVSVFYSLVSIWATKLDGTLNEEVDNSFGKFVCVRRQSVCLLCP